MYSVHLCVCASHTPHIVTGYCVRLVIFDISPFGAKSSECIRWTLGIQAQDSSPKGIQPKISAVHWASRTCYKDCERPNSESKEDVFDRSMALLDWRNTPSEQLGHLSLNWCSADEQEHVYLQRTYFYQPKVRRQQTWRCPKQRNVKLYRGAKECDTSTRSARRTKNSTRQMIRL